MLGLITSLFLEANSAHAQSTCGDRLALLGMLLRTYDETIKVTSQMNDGSQMIITAGPKGNWSMLVTSAEGKTCIVAVGFHFDDGTEV